MDRSHAGVTLAEVALRQVAALTGPAREEVLRQAMVDCLPLALAVARRFHGHGEPSEDVDQVAALAVIKAVRRYRPSGRSTLTAYTVATVEGEIKKHFRDRTWLVRPPRRIQELSIASRAARVTLGDRLGREPTDAELIEELGVPVAEFAEMRLAAQAYSPAPLERIDDQDPPGAPDGGRTEIRLGDLEDVLAALDALPAGQRTAIAMYFFAGKGQRVIAEQLGITQVQVSRLISAGLRAVRAAVEDTTGR